MMNYQCCEYRAVCNALRCLRSSGHCWCSRCQHPYMPDSGDGRVGLTAATFKVKQCVTCGSIRNHSSNGMSSHHIPEEFLFRMIQNASLSVQQQAVQMLLCLKPDGVVTYTAIG